MGYSGKEIWKSDSSAQSGEPERARLDAEKMIYDGFLKAYKVWREKADTDPSWAESHPLKFGVEKTDGRLKVLTE